MTTLSAMLTAVTEQNSSRVAIVEGEMTLTYAELSHRVMSLAAQFHELGIGPGDRAVILLPNGSHFVASYFAVVSLGGIVVPLNEQYQESELLRFLRDTGASFIITLRSFSGLFQRIMRRCAWPCKLFLVDDSSQTSTAGSRDDTGGVINPDTTVMYQFSSGSTGRPKLIARTHRNLLFELNSLIRTFKLCAEDRFLGVTPFSHVNGLMRSMMASLAAGATLYPAARFDRHAVVETIEKHRLTVFIGVPFMFGVMAKTSYSRRPDISSLRLCISASAPMPVELSRQFQNKFGMYVRQLYGSSETGTISANLNADIGESLESVGRPIAGVNVEIYCDNGQLTPENEIGEIAVKSDAAIQSYGSEDLDHGTFRNGYFFTGDLGRRNEDGLLFLLGRKKLFINKGGYKINPREVEELLESHPRIEEAIVIGVPTPFGDQKVKALIVTNAACSEQEVVEFCRGKISDFKIPSLIEFTIAFPKSPTGKVRRELLT